MTQNRCGLCRKLISDDEFVVQFGCWERHYHHEKCYPIILKRLTIFIDKVMGPEAEFYEWLEEGTNEPINQSDPCL